MNPSNKNIKMFQGECSINNDGILYRTLDCMLIQFASAAQSTIKYCADHGNIYVSSSGCSYTYNISTPVDYPEQNNKNQQLSTRRDRSSTTSDSSNDDSSKKSSIETVRRQSAYFPQVDVNPQTCWHLYSIHISNNNDLGFIAPTDSIKVPMFNLYENNEKLTVQMIYVKPVDYKECKNRLEVFCRYLFEQVFDNMNTGPGSILKFDIDQSTFKLLPCLMNEAGDIDYQRMELICNRKNKLIQNPSELNDAEIYTLLNSSENQFYMNISDVSLLKKAGDPLKNKKRSKGIRSYADYYEQHITDGMKIQRYFRMGTMKRIAKPSVNYLINSSSTTKKTSSDTFEYFPIELLRYASLNQADSELIYKLPSILVRIPQLYYIEQFRKKVADNIQCYPLLDADQMPIVTFDDCLTHILSSNASTVLPLASLNYGLLSGHQSETQPTPGLLFQAITCSSAAEDTNMEKLETLGDCFIKLAISMSLYYKFPFDDTGKLTEKRIAQAGNKNLYRLAMEKKLEDYLYANGLFYSGTEANWLPPGLTVNEENRGKYTQQKAKRKNFSDMVEALIGAFLISTDYMTTIKFMKWLGLDVIPVDKEGNMMKISSILPINGVNTLNAINSKISKLYDEHSFTEIEKKINYEFKDKAYLIAAFTHPSYFNHGSTINYKRLKFIGNALFDFLIQRCIFVNKKSTAPGRINDIQQDIINKNRQANILVENHLHKYILCTCTNLVGLIKSLSTDKENINQWADSKAPTALADVFEALVGAIFLDSDCCLEVAWNVVDLLLRPYIDYSLEHPNIQPIRSLYERGGEITDESSDGEGNFRCTVKLSDGTKITGYGKSKKLAKQYACKKAKI